MSEIIKRAGIENFRKIIKWASSFIRETRVIFILKTYLGHHAFGIESAIGSSYNFAPQLFHQINQAVKNNDVQNARELQKIVTEMFEVLFKHGMLIY